MCACRHPCHVWPCYLHPLKTTFHGKGSSHNQENKAKLNFGHPCWERAESVPGLGKAVPGHNTGKGHKPLRGQKWPLPLSPRQKKKLRLSTIS